MKLPTRISLKRGEGSPAADQPTAQSGSELDFDLDFEKFICKECQYQTYRKQSFEIHCGSKKHKFNTTPDSERKASTKLFDCSQCNYRTSRKQSFDTHCQSNKHKLAQEQEKEPKTESSMILGMNVYLCSICNYRTLQKQSMKMHMTTRKHVLRTISTSLSITDPVELKNIEAEFFRLHDKLQEQSLDETELVRYNQLEPIVGRLNRLKDFESSISIERVSDVLGLSNPPMEN